MKLNEVRPFVIDYDQRKNCKAVDKNNKKIETYYVKKIVRGGKNWHFFASVDKDFAECEKSNWNCEQNDDQLGYAYCQDALIEYVHVEGEEKDKMKARRCGIGSTLAALCMVDEDVNPGDGIALNLKRYFRGHGKEIIEKVKKECQKVVALEMEAEEGGGNTYFQAAFRAGYNRMVLYDTKAKEWIWPDVLKAQECYNEKKFGCYSNYWFFCKNSNPSDTSSATPPACLESNPITDEDECPKQNN